MGEALYLAVANGSLAACGWNPCAMHAGNAAGRGRQPVAGQSLLALYIRRLDDANLSQCSMVPVCG